MTSGGSVVVVVVGAGGWGIVVAEVPVRIVVGEFARDVRGDVDLGAGVLVVVVHAARTRLRATTRMEGRRTPPG
jgi:hypothetical protein